MPFDVLARQDPRLVKKLNDPKVQIAIELLRQGAEAHAGVKLSKYVEVGAEAAVPYSSRSLRDVAVKGVFKLKFW